MRTMLSRIRALFRRSRMDEDLDADIRAHLDLLEADYVNRGETPEAARLAARRAFGGVEPMKEIHRDRRSFIGHRLRARCPVRSAAADQGTLVLRDGDSCAVARHRGEQHGVRADERTAAARLAVRRPRSRRHDRNERGRRGSSECRHLVSRSPGLVGRAAHVRWPGRDQRDDDECRGRGNPGALHRSLCLGERVQPHRPCAGDRSWLRRERRSSRRGSGRDPERRAVAHAL